MKLISRRATSQMTNHVSDTGPGPRKCGLLFQENQLSEVHSDMTSGRKCKKKT